MNEKQYKYAIAIKLDGGPNVVECYRWCSSILESDQWTSEWSPWSPVVTDCTIYKFCDFNDAIAFKLKFGGEGRYVA